MFEIKNIEIGQTVRHDIFVWLGQTLLHVWNILLNLSILKSLLKAAFTCLSKEWCWDVQGGQRAEHAGPAVRKILREDENKQPAEADPKMGERLTLKNLLSLSLSLSPHPRIPVKIKLFQQNPGAPDFS